MEIQTEAPRAPHRSRWLVLFAVVVLAVFATGCNKLKARDELNKGVQEYKNGKYDKAIEHFKIAKDLDPGLLNARLYLATAYASQYIPGAPSVENVRYGEQAIAEFQGVLEIDANNLAAIDGIGSILYQMAATPFEPKKFDESRTYHQRHIGISPNDPEPYYWIGVIDWTLAWRANRELRAKWNTDNPRRAVKDEAPLPEPARVEFAEKYGPMIEDAIRNLNKAIELRPDYDDAMAYLNLMYRQKADVVASAIERDDLYRQADALVDKVKEIKQGRMAPAAPGS